MSEPERQLKPANENPWYVLMTLFGEQDGENYSWRTRDSNEKAWNSWFCQNLGSEERQKLANEMSAIPIYWDVWNHDITEIETKFNAEWRKRNPDASKAPKIPHPSLKCNFSQTRISKSLSASGFVFPNGLDCFQAVFEKEVSFQHAHFNGEISLSYSEFFEKLDFSLTRIEKGIFSSSAKFMEEVDFFNSVILGPAWFDFTTFSKDADFNGVTFNEEVHFSDVIFRSRVSFGRSRFHSSGSFTFSIFSDTIKGKFPYSVDFSGTRFDDVVSFFGVQFQDEYPNFHGSTLNKSALFSSKDHYWPKHSGPEKANTLFANRARASCASIRHAVAKQGLPEDEHFFYRKEMHFAGQIGSIWQRLPYRFFGLVSDYGHSIIRPTVGLFALWLIPFLIYMCYFNWIAAFGGMEGQTVGTFDSASLSFTSMFKFLGLQRLHFGAEYIQALPPFLEFLTAFQTLGGIILLFFLGLGLRTRFRLR